MGRSVVLFLAATLALAGCAGSTPDVEADASIESPEATEESVLELEVGTCLNDADTPLRADLTDVPSIPCSEPHDSELYAIVSVEDSTYPGADRLIEQGQAQCQEGFADFVGIDFRSSLLEFHFYYPTPSSWAQDDRTIYCMVFDPGLPVVGTLKDAKR
jgi:hypothetical protein